MPIRSEMRVRRSPFALKYMSSTSSEERDRVQNVERRLAEQDRELREDPTDDPAVARHVEDPLRVQYVGEVRDSRRGPEDVGEGEVVSDHRGRRVERVREPENGSADRSELHLGVASGAGPPFGARFTVR